MISGGRTAQTEEVDDVDTTQTLISTPDAGTALGLSRYVASAPWAFPAPDAMTQGTSAPFAGTSAAAHSAQVAFGARVAALPGLPPRGAPV